LDSSLSNPQQSLNRCAIAIAAIGGIGLGWMVLIIATRIGLNGAMWSFYPIRSAIVPVLYIVFAWLIARRSYGALVACGVIAASTLASLLLSLPFTFRYVSVLNWGYFYSFGSPILVLVSVLRARPLMMHWPDTTAVDRARGRATILLYIGGAMMFLLAAIPVVLLLIYLASASGGRLGPDEWLVFAIVGVICAVFSICGAVALISGRRLSRFRRATGRMVAGSMVSLLIIVFLVDSLLGGRLPFGYGYLSYFGWLIPFAFKLVMVWQLIDLLHARRVCEEPASYGFEPIFAKPVMPVVQARID